jgi:hypothetical protein
VTKWDENGMEIILSHLLIIVIAFTHTPAERFCFQATGNGGQLIITPQKHANQLIKAA